VLVRTRNLSDSSAILIFQTEADFGSRVKV
jgi:hypothetical protein